MGLLDAFKNTNIFGARRPTYLEGIATPEQLKQAEQQSLVQGLLGTAVGYLAQPKNQGYGSAVPYLAKGYLQGMQSAQAPYQGLERDVLMKSKFQDIKREQDVAKQQRQMTEQLLNDPRVQGNPLYESMAVNAPADLFKELEKVTPLRKGGKLVRNVTGEVIAEAPEEPKVDKFTDLYGTPKEDARYGLVYLPKDPKYPVLDAKGKVIPDYKPLPKEDKITTKTPSKPTNVDISNVKKISNDLLTTDIDTAEAAVIASRANKKMADEGISFDEAVISIIEEVTREEKPTTIFGFEVPSTGGKSISKKKLLSPKNDDWKIEKIN